MSGDWKTDMFVIQLDPKNGCQNRDNSKYFVVGGSLEEKVLLIRVPFVRLVPK